MALSARDRKMIGLLGILLVGAVPYGIYAYPYQDYVKWGREIATKQEELRRAEDAARRLSLLQEERKRLEEDFEASKRRLPQRGELLVLDQKITDLLKECGIDAAQIQALTINPEAPVAGKPYNAVSVNVTLSNVEWAEVLTFIGRVERLDRLFDVPSITLTPSGDRYAVTMTLETYVLPEGA